MNVREYFELLAAKHLSVKHTDEKPHFACSVDDAETLMARKLYYPAIFLDEGDILFTGSAGNELVEREYSLAIVTHVKDAGNKNEIAAAFSTTEDIMHDVVARMVQDRRKGLEPVRRFSVIGSEAHRVELVEAGLYGWIVLFSLSTKFCDISTNAFAPDTIESTESETNNSETDD